MTFTTIQLANHFALNVATIKRYAEEFKNYLSPTATPEQGKTRRFTENDVTVYDLIVTMKQEGKHFEEIHAALMSGVRGNLPDFEIGAMTPAQSTAQLRLMQQIKELQVEVERLRSADIRNEILSAELKEARAEIKELYKQIGRLEG